MIKAVSFDVGGTLIRPFPSVGAIYSQVAAKHGVEAAADVLDERFKLAWNNQKPERKEIDKAWWRTVVAATFEDFRFSNFENFFADLYHAFERKEAWSVFPDVLPALEELKQRQLRLFVCSNWDDRLPALLNALQLEHFFERQFISCQLRLIKPDPAFFRHALQVMELHPLEVIHVGDDFDEDVKGAEAAGIRAYLLQRNLKPLSSRYLSSLSDIFQRV